MNLFDVYSVLNIEPVRAKGCLVYDKEGTAYLDLYGGHAVISIGHTHPHYVSAMEKQLGKIGFYSNAVLNGLQDRYATLLGALSDGYNDYSLFLCNSGAEANENALKLASFQTGKKRVIAFKGAFHGRTSGAVAVTDIPAYRSPFNETEHVSFVPLNDAEAVEAELSKGDCCAVIIEGIQGVNGIRLPDDSFLKQVRALCTHYKAMLILDEIQSGCGRTGKYFSHQYAGIRADLVTLAKGIGNGFPMAAVLVSPDFKAVKGSLGTTFGGAHLACAAGIAVAEVMHKENLIGSALQIGDYLMKELLTMGNKIKEVRGRGLMIGIEMDYPVADLRKDLLFKHHIFTGSSGSSIIRLLPPLNLTKAEADQFLNVFRSLLQ